MSEGSADSTERFEVSCEEWGRRRRAISVMYTDVKHEVFAVPKILAVVFVAIIAASFATAVMVAYTALLVYLFQWHHNSEELVLIVWIFSIVLVFLVYYWYHRAKERSALQSGDEEAGSR